MASNDALIVGEGWISEHYFTADSTKESFQAKVNERRKAWDDEVQPAAGGPVSTSTRSRFTSARISLETRLGALSSAGDRDDSSENPIDAEPIRALYSDLLKILGYQTGVHELATDGPITWLRAPGVTTPAVAAWPCEAHEDLLSKDTATLLEPWQPDPNGPASASIESVARALSAIFTAATPPPFALVLAGRWCLIAEQQRWPEGRYLAIDLQLICEQNDNKRGGGIDQALACLDAASLAPDAAGTIWWTAVLDESIKHTVGVSKDLREGVRLSIEIIANDVVRRRVAAGLHPLPAEQAQPLAIQALRFLYRILFLLYAEASPELAVLPVGAGEYESGYGLGRLRELTLVELQTPGAQEGTHLYQSLQRLFELVDSGHRPKRTGMPTDGLAFSSLRADLFKPSATAMIDETKLSNDAVLQVLRHLLLSKESRGRDRGFISYVELGINQLGAVYEGLMSYTGFFAQDDLYEVAKNGDPADGSWVVPISRSSHLAEKDFVRLPPDPETGERRAVQHAKGSFVFRLAGRERQQSASYYTPEVLTRFTVSQALEELLDQDGETTTAAQVLQLAVCEPALGSGAFAIEAVRQLAAEYLKRREAELGQRIDPDAYPQELQRVKAHTALHQVYGVDLNATAVELAEVSLWLDTMVTGLQAPWFGLRLRRGNSLVGARRSVYPVGALTDNSFRGAVPVDVPMTELANDLDSERVGRSTGGRVHHFLLPADGWGSAVEVPKEVKDLAAPQVAALKSWRSSVRRKLDKKQIAALSGLSDRVEQLWQTALRRLRIAEAETSRSIALWDGNPKEGETESPAQTVAESAPAVSREQIEDSLADPEGAYRRLRLVMDAWCALWFWPLTESRVDDAVVSPPTVALWIDALTMILGRDTLVRNRHGLTEENFHPLAAATDWNQVGDFEQSDRAWHDARPMSAVLTAHPWLRVCQTVASRQGFFHWELDFASVFARGGFDLQVGNPPWVRPTADVDALLAEGDPWWQLAEKPSEGERQERLESTMAISGVKALVAEATGDVISLREYVGSGLNFPALAGLQPDLYRCFMTVVWRHSSTYGIASMVHPESHFTDERAAVLRQHTYARMRRHWQFVNELTLYEIDHHVSYGIHIYGSATGEPKFLQASSLYHPDTVERSLKHDGTGVEPGQKDEQGNWDVRPHQGRIQTVTPYVLTIWRDALESPEVPPSATRMLYTTNSASLSTLERLAERGRVGEIGLSFSSGWHERADRQKGRFTLRWGEAEWKSAILQGPHLHVATPLYKTPNSTMRNNLDWSATDLEALANDTLPVTAYKPAGQTSVYNAQYTHWGNEGEYAARDFYRIAWRRMAANTGERTLTPALIPPGAAHVHPVTSAGLPNGDQRCLVAAIGVLSSILSDFNIRSAPKSDIHGVTINRLAMADLDHPLLAALILRTLRLNCVTDAFVVLWEKSWERAFLADVAVLPTFAASIIGPKWTRGTPLRRAADRRNALVEIDALVALMLGVPIDDLCTIYRTQFAVLYGYDHCQYTFDADGRQVPTSVLQPWRKAGGIYGADQTQLSLSREDRTATHPGSGIDYTYRLPFAIRDREADFRTAHAEFSRRLALLNDNVSEANDG